jgi:hypothetical protein
MITVAIVLNLVQEQNGEWGLGSGDFGIDRVPKDTIPAGVTCMRILFYSFGDSLLRFTTARRDRSS